MAGVRVCHDNGDREIRTPRFWNNRASRCRRFHTHCGHGELDDRVQKLLSGGALERASGHESEATTSRLASTNTTAVGFYTVTHGESTIPGYNLGITLQPGVSVNGAGSLWAMNLVSYLAFNAGTANAVTFNVTWSTTETTQTITMSVYNTSGVLLQTGLLLPTTPI